MAAAGFSLVGSRRFELAAVRLAVCIIAARPVLGRSWPSLIRTLARGLLRLSLRRRLLLVPVSIHCYPALPGNPQPGPPGLQPLGLLLLPLLNPLLLPLICA